jgi:hypothetical protein
MALATQGGVTGTATAHAANCSWFDYEVNFGEIRIYAFKVRHISCRSAKQLIRAGSPPASSYNWIEGYSCGPAYGGKGYLCTRSKKRIKWKWKLL